MDFGIEKEGLTASHWTLAGEKLAGVNPPRKS